MTFLFDKCSFHSLVSPHSDVCILLDTLSLLQHITFPTHIKGNTLDCVITNCKANIISNTISSSLISDNFSITFNIDIPKSHIISNACSYRRIYSINTNIIISDFNDIVFPGIYITQLNDILDLLLNKHTPLVTPNISNMHRAPWYNTTLANLKHRTRYYERYFVKVRSDISYELFRKVRSEYRNSIKEFKIKYIKNTIEYCAINSRKFYSLINKLTGRKNNIIVFNIPDNKICSTFITHFRDKITMICDTIKIAKFNISINLNQFAPDFIPDSNFSRNYSFSDFYMVSDSEIHDLIMSSSSTSPNNILTLSLIKKLSYILVPHYCSIVNFFFIHF